MSEFETLWTFFLGGGGVPFLYFLAFLGGKFGVVETHHYKKPISNDLLMPMAIQQNYIAVSRICHNNGFEDIIQVRSSAISFCIYRYVGWLVGLTRLPRKHVSTQGTDALFLCEGLGNKE